MFLLKIVLVVVLALVIEKPTTRTRTIFAFSRGAAERARASSLGEWELGHSLPCWPEEPDKV
jgi:hypothetical protein